MRSFLEPLAQNARPTQGFVQFVASYQHVRQRAVGRIVHPTAEAQFFFVETGEVVLRRILNRVVIGKESLQHNFAGSLSAPGASRDLSEKLKGSLGGAEVGKS